ncbi:MAG: HipA domain-containing protein [Cytophagales bacterium]|nr:HipA domain-containing protein [Cytophagales bacterium]
MGFLTSSLVRGNEIFAFEYDKNWLNTSYAQFLDPNLQLYSGPQYLSGNKSNFGIFLDSSPDRWGRLLMRRREAALARKEERKPQNLYESDYLLGVFDGHRMGALRFKEAESDVFLNANKDLASPPWTSLRELEYASLQLEKEDSVDDPEYLQWLNMLIAPGSSLGGARPKASVLDNNNHLWIAKFPSRSDNHDIGAWEKVVHELALKAGINMAEARVEKYGSNQHTFLTKRFDRTNQGERIHFASAMTLLGYNDGTDHQDGASYLELAEFITQHGGQVKTDLEELWKRIVFNICVTNTDDHLRNHGFLLRKEGWRLSPAYDINPIETGMGLKLNISENDNSLDLNLAIEVAPHFRVDKTRASHIIDEMIAVIKTWRTTATHYGIPRSDQEQMERAFKFAQ